MCKILKTADCRAKRSEIWGGRSCVLHMGFMSDSEFSLELFGVLCKIPDVEIFKRLLLLSHFSADIYQTLEST